MIVAMKHLDLLCVAADAEALLARVRALGAVHLDLSRAVGARVEELKGEIADAERAVRLVEKARSEAGAAAGAPRAARAVAEILALSEDAAARAAEAERWAREIKIYEPYGDFDPALARRLLERGDAAEWLKGKLPERLPERRLSEMRAAGAAAREGADAARAALAATDTEAVLAAFPALRERMEFEQARGLLETRGAVAVVSGWAPVTAVDALRAAARAEGWGVLLRDPAADETPPTLIEPPRLFRPVKALFEGLGIAPGYTEADVSVPFMCYFALFFAMLVGDGGYGALILALTLAGWRKTRPAAGARRPVLVRSWLTLLTVFSLATVAWGLLSNTWFGAGLPFAAQWPTVVWLADPSYQNMMLLCFTIGASHLVLARLWSAVSLFPDRTFLSQIGWAGIVFFMYWVTCSIVGIFTAFPGWLYAVLGVSLVLVFGFTLKGHELKSRGIELGMMPLNVMSCLGDIISYVRLFAVGLASVKVAENFNAMATGLELPLWIKWLPLVLILLVGHGLNFAMAGLSILVHAVRLNTLEFSNHKGISWAGYAFRPFRARGRE